LKKLLFALGKLKPFYNKTGYRFVETGNLPVIGNRITWRHESHGWESWKGSHPAR